MADQTQDVDGRAEAQPAWVIRHADSGDADVLADLGSRTFRDTYAAEARPEYMDDFLAGAYRAEDIRAELTDERHLYLLAEVDGTPAGFAHLRTDEQHDAVTGRRPLHLAHLYLDRAFQGQGLGAGLMERCLAEADGRGHDVLWLAVWERNPKAIAFYERWGFASVGETPFEFGDELHRDIVMQRPVARIA